LNLFDQPERLRSEANTPLPIWLSMRTEEF
jgi:hypothetical protein